MAGTVLGTQDVLVKHKTPALVELALLPGSEDISNDYNNNIC